MKVLIENPEGAVKVMGDFSHFKYFKNDDTLCLYTDTVDEDDAAFIEPEEDEACIQVQTLVNVD